MNNFYHRLWILVHKLRFYRQEGRVLTGNDVLKEEKLLQFWKVPWQILEKRNRQDEDANQFAFLIKDKFIFIHITFFFFTP